MLCAHVRQRNSVAEELYILGVLDPLVCQDVHPNHVVPAALEVLGVHQDLFLLCALGTKAKKIFRPLSEVDEVEDDWGL